MIISKPMNLKWVWFSLPPKVNDLVLGKVIASYVGHNWWWGLQQWRCRAWILVWLFCCLLRCRLGDVCLVFKLKTTLKLTTWLIVQVAKSLTCTGPAWKFTKEFHSQSISIVWVPILGMVWLKYLPRLGMLFYILSCLGSILLGLAGYSKSSHAVAKYILSCLVSVACYSISCHRDALAVSAEAWHDILYLDNNNLVTPWQYQPKDQPPKIQATKS